MGYELTEYLGLYNRHMILLTFSRFKERLGQLTQTR